MLGMWEDWEGRGVASLSSYCRQGRERGEEGDEEARKGEQRARESGEAVGPDGQGTQDAGGKLTKQKERFRQLSAPSNQ
jgi:hypothetical protein